MRPHAELALALTLALALGLAAAAGCGPQRREPLAGTPVTVDTPAERRGERLFYRFCAKCHPGGEAGLGPALNNKPLPEVAIRAQIRKGLGAMPAFPEDRLPDAQVAEIADYVAALRKAPAPPERPAPPPPGEQPETAASRR